MNPLIFSLISLVLVAISANFLSLIKNNKTLLYISTIPCIYLVIYGLYLILGPVNLYEDGSQNFFNQNPKEKELVLEMKEKGLLEWIILSNLEKETLNLT